MATSSASSTFSIARAKVRRRIHLGFRMRSPMPPVAGEPAHCGYGDQHQGVHPRVGGGAESRSLTVTSGQGASPRGRGSLEQRALPMQLKRVDPRVGGGAAAYSSADPKATGASPRGRGSPPIHAPNYRLLGASPRGRGEPSRKRMPEESGTRVHPRVGGGARVCRFSPCSSQGASPRGRGSLQGVS